MPEMTRTTATPQEQTEARERTLSPALGWVGAMLALGVAWIHVVDQGGMPGSKSPTYVGIGYYVLELVAVLVAITLFLRPGRNRVATWLAAGAVAAGPLAGYVLSRGPGLPGYTDDRGNWAEPIGLLSLVVEGLLLLLSLGCARALQSSRNATPMV